MGRRNYVEAEKKQQSPMLPIIGFVVILIVGGAAFLVSPRVVTWLGTTHFSLGGLITVLPIAFPKGWSPLANQLAVTAFMFILLFTIVMSGILFFIGKSVVGETDVNLDDIRREKQRKMRGR
jgi:hypothetical protein